MGQNWLRFIIIEQVPFNSPVGLILLMSEQDVFLEGMLEQSKEEALIRSTWED